MKLYFLALTVFFAIDMVWLGVVAKNFYAQQIGFLMKTQINWIAALLFYLLFIVGVVVFVVAPALAQNNLWSAVWMGALFGLITYATYDLTNLATIKDWPILVTIVDLLWGTFLSASVSTLTFILAKKLGI